MSFGKMHMDQFYTLTINIGHVENAWTGTFYSSGLLLGLQIQLLFGSLDSLTAHCRRSVNDEVLCVLTLFLRCQDYGITG